MIHSTINTMRSFRPEPANSGGVDVKVKGTPDYPDPL